jgi:epoxyqueuosine reductase QueG
MPRKAEEWQAPAEALAAMPSVSGNTVNGLYETQPRRAAPFFWHDPKYHAFGEMQAYTLRIMYGLEDAAEIIDAFHLVGEQDFGHRGPEPIDVAPDRVDKAPANWSSAIKEFALANDADVVGIAEMQPRWVYEGFEVKEKYVVVIGVGHDYEKISQAPSVPGNNEAIVEIGRQYTRAATAAAKLLNFVRGQGHPATLHPGPAAMALLMIPAAIAAGLGELGKHGSIINRKLGSSFRLSAITTDMPLLPDQPDVFGGDDFCTRCQVCVNACPPDAIFNEKQWVRGDHKWYIDFDKCIPYFAETRGCGICIVVCPWSLPGVADNLLVKMARRRERRAGARPNHR